MDVIFRVAAARQDKVAPNEPYGIHLVIVRAEVPTLEDAQKFVSDLPMSWRIKAQTLTRAKGGDWNSGTEKVGCITLEASFREGVVSGVRNETGKNRVRKFLARVNWEYVTPYLNSATEAEFSDWLSRDMERKDHQTGGSAK